MGFPRAFLCFIFILPLLVSCGNTDGQHNADSIPDSARSANTGVTLPDSVVQPEITFKTFASKDNAGAPGWGYDLYVGKKKTIHQPIIPAVPGNDAFATEEEAKRAGELAVYKMKSTGAFPTITIHDLDSLGIKHK